MSRVDAAGNPLTGATLPALKSYEQALSAFQNWGDPSPHLERAIAEAPDFPMGQVLHAYLMVCGRDPHRIRRAQAVHDRAAALRLNAREGLHLRAISKVISGDYVGAVGILDELLALCPRDALALQAAQCFDYLIGNAPGMLNRVARVMPSWTTGAPGCEAVLAMSAFALGECGYYDRAEECALSVLEMDPLHVPAHHVMAHLFEMTDRADFGVRWIDAGLRSGDLEPRFTTHCWWHLALFHLSLGEPEAALHLYDDRILNTGTQISDLIDASALLWRIGLSGADVGDRWRPLAAAWDHHIEDTYCSFSDLHATLAFVGAEDWTRAARLERALAVSGQHATRHGETTRRIGLPALHALIAYGKGDNAAAAETLSRLPPLAHQFGGSHAQRDVLNATLLAAVQNLRRPARKAFRGRYVNNVADARVTETA